MVSALRFLRIAWRLCGTRRRAWRRYLRWYRAERSMLAAAGWLLLPAASVALLHGMLTWRLVWACATATAIGLVAVALGRILAGVLLDYRFARRFARLGLDRQVYLLTGSREAEAQVRELLAAATRPQEVSR